tara:strand:+ start:195 stop:422 length:228 start_codon:yes stop_codon:yes gene_type:complete
MIKKYFLFWTTVLFYFLFEIKAYAYLDPGTGSVILTAIIAAIATAGATITHYWRKIKMKIKGLFVRKDKNNSSDK